jgi:hypothetical protein
MIEKTEKLKDIQISEQGSIAWGIDLIILEDGKEISRTCKRTSIHPDHGDHEDDVDTSTLPVLVQQAITETWTPEVIEAYKQSLPKPEELPSIEPESTTEE